MTPRECEEIKALARCRFQPATHAKRFARDMDAKTKDYELSANQQRYLQVLLWRYRRQIPPNLCPTFKPGERK